jgi:hypothetical protein
VHCTSTEIDSQLPEVYILKHPPYLIGGPTLAGIVAQPNLSTHNRIPDTTMDRPRSCRDGKAPKRFLDLPTEVRELIYADVFRDSQSPFALYSGMRYSPLTFWKTVLPGVCFLNRQIHAEALRTWFRCTVFIVHSESSQVIGFDKFCTKYNMWREVRYLKFGSPRLHYGPLHPVPGMPTTHLLVEKCSALQELTFSIPETVLFYPHGAIRPTANLIKDYRFEALLALPCLCKFEIICVSKIGHTLHWSTPKALAMLVSWFEHEFRIRGKATIVTAR